MFTVELTIAEKINAKFIKTQKDLVMLITEAEEAVEMHRDYKPKAVLSRMELIRDSFKSDLNSLIDSVKLSEPTNV